MMKKKQVFLGENRMFNQKNKTKLGSLAAMITKYSNFKPVHYGGKRGPNAPSATKARTAAVAGNTAAFRSMVSPKLNKTVSNKYMRLIHNIMSAKS